MILTYPEQELSHQQQERICFEKNIREAGLKTETEEIQPGETVHYLKISAPWQVLTKHAEILKFRMPIKVTNLFYFFEFKIFKTVNV